MRNDDGITSVGSQKALDEIVVIRVVVATPSAIHDAQTPLGALLDERRRYWGMSGRLEQRMDRSEGGGGGGV